jgi:protein TonB
MLFIGFAFAGKKTLLAKEFIIPIDSIGLKIIEPPLKPEPPPPPPMKPPAPPAQVQMKQFTPPRIVPADQVNEEDKPPVNETLEDVKIGNMNKDGIAYDGIVDGPVSEAAITGVIELPKKEVEEGDGIPLHVEIESEYPGGLTAWKRFLDSNLRYPTEAVDQGIEGFVTVQFVVDKEGNVSNVEAVSGPQELRGEAVRVIKKSGKWTPAIQNGHKVKSYKKQPIGFRIAAE